KAGSLLGTIDGEEVESLALDGCRPCCDSEGQVRREGGGDGVSGDGGEVGDQRLEAVDRKAVWGASGSLLGNGGGRSLGLGDDAGAERLGGLFVVVIVEHRRQALAHVPFEIISEHTEKDVSAHAVGQPVIDWPDLQILTVAAWSSAVSGRLVRTA